MIRTKHTEHNRFLGIHEERVASELVKNVSESSRIPAKAVTHKKYTHTHNIEGFRGGQQHQEVHERGGAVQRARRIGCRGFRRFISSRE